MPSLISPTFWADMAKAKLYNTLQSDGSLRFVLLDQQYQMVPMVRTTSSSFTEFLNTDYTARTCKVVINGNQYGFDLATRLTTIFTADDPKKTEVHGLVLYKQTRLTGDSRPLSFWFGQVSAPMARYPWTYMAGTGDPPITGSVLAAVGGAGPMIVDSLAYGRGNAYKPGAPTGVPEPSIGDPPPVTKPYLIQRNNQTFVEADRRSPEGGKTVLAYCSSKRALLVAVQPDGVEPGQSHTALTAALAARGFDSAVFLDGSDSSTMAFDGKLIVSPGHLKNDAMTVAIGFCS